ncbi:hypothetical protein ACWEV4_33355 [Streptomyces sp. NPDC003860]
MAAYLDVLGWSVVVGGEPVDAVTKAVTGLAHGPLVSVAISLFDVLALPQGLHAAMHWDGVLGPGMVGVPWVRGAGEQAAFLVAAGSGRAVQHVPGVRVLSRGQLRVPPTAGLTWDTPPWDPRAPEPAPLVDASVLEPALRAAMHVNPSALRDRSHSP